MHTMDVLIKVGYNLSHRKNYGESMIEHVFSRTDMDSLMDQDINKQQLIGLLSKWVYTVKCP